MMKPSEQMRMIGNGLANEATTRAQAHSAGASILRLAAVMAALEGDAERYRWLRDTNNNTEIRSNDEHIEPLQVPVIYVGHPPEHWTLGAFASAPVGEGFDRAIDAAMLAARGIGAA